MSNTNSGLLGIKDIVFMNVIAILSLRKSLTWRLTGHRPCCYG